MKNLTPTQYSTIDRYKTLGKILAEEIPEISNDYRHNLTLREIVVKYNIMERYNIINEEIARSAVSYAIKNLLQEQELERLIKIHNHNNWIRTMQDREYIFWTDKEKNLLLKIASQQKYNIKGKANRKLIAEELNKLIHKGKNVRNNKSVSAMIFRIKKSYI